MSATSKQLAGYLAEQRLGAFDWQHANCCHFAAGWVRHATGVDPLAGLPSTPTLRDALRVIRSLGDSITDACTRQLGSLPIAPELAQVGDVVLMPMPEGTGASLGVCGGRYAIFLAANGHHVFLPMSVVTRAWRLRGEAC